MTSNDPSLLDRFRRGDWDDLAWYELAPIVPIYVALLAIREAIRDRVQVLSANLTFITALTIVPLLSVALWMLAAFGIFEEANNADLTAYLQQLFPAVASEVAGYLHTFADTSARDLGLVGAIALMVVGIFLYIWVERTFNDVWSTSQKRPWYLKILAFYAMITLGPVALGASIVMSARAQIRLSHMGLDTSFLDAYVPLLLGVVVFSGLNFLMPHTKVKWYAALAAGVTSALLFEVAKWGFNLYVTEVVLESYNAIYGALGLFPLFLIWLYVLWIIVLIGAEIAYSIQNLRTLVAVRTAESSEPQKHREHVTNPLVGLELYAPIARRFKGGGGAMAESALTQKSGYSEVLVREVIDQLESRGLVVVVEDDEVGRAVMPSKQLDDIQLLALVESFFDMEYEGNSVPMRELTEGYRALTLEVLRSRTALDLIAEHAEFQKKYGGVAPWRPIPQSALSAEHPRPRDPLEEAAAAAAASTQVAESPRVAQTSADDEGVEGTRRLKPGRDKGNITWVGPEDEHDVSEDEPTREREQMARPEPDDLPEGPPDEESTIPLVESDRYIEEAFPQSTATFTFEDDVEVPHPTDLSGDEILVSDSDIEVSDAVETASDEELLRRTSEIDAEEVEIMDDFGDLSDFELGDELSAPPPMPPKEM